MKLSEIQPNDLQEYLRLDSFDPILNIFLESAKAYIRSYTGMTDEEIDKHPDIIPVVYVLVSDMYDNREYAQKSARITITPNIVAKTTLDMYCKNLL